MPRSIPIAGPSTLLISRARGLCACARDGMATARAVVARKRAGKEKTVVEDASIDRSIGRSVEVAIERETDRPVRGRTHDAYIVHTVGVYACVMRVMRVI